MPAFGAGTDSGPNQTNLNKFKIAFFSTEFTQKMDFFSSFLKKVTNLKSWLLPALNLKLPRHLLALSNKLKPISEFSRCHYASLRPGDIITFDYKTDQQVYGTKMIKRLGVVMKSLRAPEGRFLSTRGNRLLNVMVLDSIGEEGFNTAVNTLYKDKAKSDYYRVDKYINPIGITVYDRFRTFKVSGILNLMKITIDMKKFLTNDIN